MAEAFIGDYIRTPIGSFGGSLSPVRAHDLGAIPLVARNAGVESMLRAPFVIPKADSAFSHPAEIHDTTIGWRFVNPLMKEQYGIESMPESGENVTADLQVSCQDQFALRSQAKAAAAQKSGRLAKEITPVTTLQRKGATRFSSNATSIRARQPSRHWRSLARHYTRTAL